MHKSREKKYRLFLSLTKPSKESRLLDVGVAGKEYSPFDNYLEKKYPYPHKITALSIHSLQEFHENYPQIVAITYKGNKFPLKEKQFDIAVSNAVIEHVGDFHAQLQFINEMRRVSHQFYFSTPAREFPIEIHTNYPFIHWFRRDVFDKVVTFMGKGWASGRHINLLSKNDIKKLLKSSDATEFKIFTHRFGPFPLQYSIWGK